MPISRGTVVVGPQTGATLLAENFAQLLREEYGFPIFSASPAKHGEGENKQMLFTPEEKDLLLGHEVLSIEDVITTGGSIELATQAVVNAGGIALPFVFTLVNRSGLTTVDGKRIIALINRHLPIWTPNECPLCKQGSKAVRAKDNWVLLTANYK